MAFYEEIVGRARFIRERFQKLSAEEKRRLAVICTAAFSLILIISVIVPIVSKSRKKAFAEAERPAIISPIPAEDLFLPDEPDFVPGVLLEREQRTSWTEDDASEYWQDPLKFGEEQWREKIEAAIDNFMERIP
jgi:hypothetical protein